MQNFLLPLHLPVHPAARVDAPKQLIAVDVFTAPGIPAQYVVLMSRADALKLYLSLGEAIREFDDAAAAKAEVVRLPARRKKG